MAKLRQDLNNQVPSTELFINSNNVMTDFSKTLEFNHFHKSRNGYCYSMQNFHFFEIPYHGSRTVDTVQTRVFDISNS
jgi:hypothetical protein